MNSFSKRLGSILISLGSFLVAVVIGEGLLRLKNSDMKNYDIEMWRYAKELKQVSPVPGLGHEHIPNASAQLQGVPVRINSWGLRGGPITAQPTGRRILVLGSSVALGWGVREEEATAGQLSALFAQQSAAEETVEVLNAGIGNYSAARYVELFFQRYARLKPTDIVVQYFPRDAIVLENNKEHWLVRHSQLAASAYAAVQKLGAGSQTSIEKYYAQYYAPESVGYQQLDRALQRLSAYAHQNGIRLVLALNPEMRDLEHHALAGVHATVKEVAENYGYEFIDLSLALQGMSPASAFVMPGDPHPSAEAHRRMAAAIFERLARPTPVLRRLATETK